MLSFEHVTLEAARYNWLGCRRWQPLLCDIDLQRLWFGDEEGGPGC